MEKIELIIKECFGKLASDLPTKECARRIFDARIKELEQLASDKNYAYECERSKVFELEAENKRLRKALEAQKEKRV